MLIFYKMMEYIVGLCVTSKERSSPNNYNHAKDNIMRSIHKDQIKY